MSIWSFPIPLGTDLVTISLSTLHTAPHFASTFLTLSVCLGGGILNQSQTGIKYCTSEVLWMWVKKNHTSVEWQSIPFTLLLHCFTSVPTPITHTQWTIRTSLNLQHSNFYPNHKYYMGGTEAPQPEILNNTILTTHWPVGGGGGCKIPHQGFLYT